MELKILFLFVIILATLFSGCLNHDIVRATKINQTIYNTTGGGGVSFNGSPVNLNGSLLYNGTLNTTQIIMEGNSTKRLQINYYPNGSFIMVEI